MLKSRWLQYIALGIAICLAVPALGQDAVQPQGPSKNETKSKNVNDDRKSDRAVDAPKTPAPVANEKQSADKAKKDNKPKTDYDPKNPLWDWRPYVVVTPGDTLAQWVMAIFGIAATFISVYAVVLLKRTLSATRETLTAANNTLQAERAWMISPKYEIGILKNCDIGGIIVKQSISFQFLFSNTGRSPAIDTEVYINYKIVRQEDGIPFFDYLNTSEPSKSKAAIGQNSTISTDPVAFTEEELAKFWGGGVYCLYLWMR